MEDNYLTFRLKPEESRALEQYVRWNGPIQQSMLDGHPNENARALLEAFKYAPRTRKDITVYRSSNYPINGKLFTSTVLEKEFGDKFGSRYRYKIIISQGTRILAMRRKQYLGNSKVYFTEIILPPGYFYQGADNTLIYNKNLRPPLPSSSNSIPRDEKDMDFNSILKLYNML